MTKKTLGQLFKQSLGKPVIYENRLIHAAVFRNVTKPGRFVVRFVKAIAKPVQALLIDIDPGQIIIEDTVSRKMILRLDTSPDVVEVRYKPARKSSRIWLYNGWINENGGADAWLMNSGMLVEEIGNKIILHCSDGCGDPTFDDLIVEIDFLDD